MRHSTGTSFTVLERGGSELRSMAHPQQQEMERDPQPREEGVRLEEKSRLEAALAGEAVHTSHEAGGRELPTRRPHRPRRGRQVTNLPSLCRRVRVITPAADGVGAGNPQSLEL